MNLDELIADISGLSDDPNRAFFEYEEQRRDRLNTSRKNGGHVGWKDFRNYIDELIVFMEIYGENDYFKIPKDVPANDDKFIEFYNVVVNHINRSKHKFALKEAIRAKELSDRVILLADESKVAIRTLIEAIKAKVAKMELSEAKRGALMKKLNSFLAELDQNFTHTEAFFSFVVEASRASREAGAEFKGLSERIDRVLDLIDDGKKWVESLPGFRKPKQLEPPPKQIEGPKDRLEEII